MTPGNITALVEFREAFANERLQLLVLVGLSLGIVVLTFIAYLSDRLLFQRFLGRINPLLAIAVIVLLGGILMAILLSRGWFAIYKTEAPKRFFWSSGLAALMAGIMILVDLKVVFPADLNIPFPQSLLYYPVIDYAVQILFHLLPLSIILISLTSLSQNLGFAELIWPCILVVALLEPVLQATSFVRNVSSSTAAYVALHVYVFTVIELWLFKRFDFVTMYSFRLVYYLIWHILWGTFRIGLLF